MSRGYWFAAIAVGLILFGGLGQAQDQPDKTRGEADAHQRPSYQLPVSVPVNIIEDKATSDARDRHEAEARQREIEDLVAQQGMNSATQAMNDATQRMARYALWSTGLVAVGTALLFVTLHLTRQANRAAQAAVDVTREIGMAQVRAYVLVEKSIFIYDGNIAKAKFAIYNRGQSPAYNIRIFAGIEPPTDPFDVSSWDRLEEFDGGGALFGEAGFQPLVARQLDWPIPNGVGNGDALCDLLTTIEYTDVFGNRCSDHFRTTIHPYSNGQYGYMSQNTYRANSRQRILPDGQ